MFVSYEYKILKSILMSGGRKTRGRKGGSATDQSSLIAKHCKSREPVHDSGQIPFLVRPGLRDTWRVENRRPAVVVGATHQDTEWGKEHMNAITGAALAVGLMVGAQGVQALTLDDIDLSGFSFDIVSYTPASGATRASAAGTSNGVGWRIDGFDTWSGRTVTSGSFAFAALPVSTDNLHPSTDFTIVFDRPVSSLLVALGNDNTTDSINFGRVPTAFSGLSLSGTQIVLNNAAGGLALFENIDALTVTHSNTNGVTDGFDFAFHVVASVPEPETYALLLAGLGLVGWASRRRAG
jgi:hypothetical protein